MDEIDAALVRELMLLIYIRFIIHTFDFVLIGFQERLNSSQLYKRTDEECAVCHHLSTVRPFMLFVAPICI